MARLFRKPHRVQRVFRLYFPLLFLITAVLSFSHLKQSQESLMSYTLLYAQKNNEVLQTSFYQAAEQIATQFSLLNYDAPFRAVMEAASYRELFFDWLQIRQRLHHAEPQRADCVPAHHQPARRFHCPGGQRRKRHAAG